MSEPNVQRRKLTDSEFEELAYAMRNRTAISEIASTLIINVIDEMLRRQERNWDAVARMLGFASRADAEKQGYTVIINWVTREIRSEPLKEVTDE